MSSEQTNERDKLRSAIGGVLVNASNFPPKMQFRMLGQDMGPLIEKVVDAALATIQEARASGWDEGALRVARQTIDESEWPDEFWLEENPHRTHESPDARNT